MKVCCNKCGHPNDPSEPFCLVCAQLGDNAYFPRLFLPGEMNVITYDKSETPEPIKFNDQPVNLSGGVKHDGAKPILALLPPKALWQIGQAFTFGAGKYGQFNHMAGIQWVRLLSASLRHIFQFIAGEDYDTDPNCDGCKVKDCKMHSGLPHWANACANLMMLGEQHMRGNTKLDDRYKNDQA